MFMRRLSVLLMALLLAGCDRATGQVAAVAPGAIVPPLAARIPADALIYVGWAGADHLPPAYEQSHLKALLEASNFKDLVEKTLPSLGLKLAQSQPQDIKEMAEVFDVLGSAWRYPTAMYVGPVEWPQDGPPKPHIAFLCQAGAGADALQKRLQSLLADAAQELPFPLKIGRDGDLVYVTLGAVELPPAAAGGAGSLLRSKTFLAALGRVQPDPVFIAYADAAGLVKLADDAAAHAPGPDPKAIWTEAREALGFSGLTQGIVTAGFEGKNWSTRGFLGAPSPRKGMMSLLDGGSVSEQTLALVPRSAAMAIGMRLDHNRLLDHIRELVRAFEPRAAAEMDEGLKELSAMLGMDVRKDLLACLGEEWIGYTDQAIGGTGILGLVAVNRLRDPAKAQEVLAKLKAKANDALARSMAGQDVKISIKSTQAGDLTIHYLAVPIAAPCWAIHEGNLYFALYPQVLASAVDFARGKGPSLALNPEFARLRGALGGQKAVAFSYNDLPQTISSGYGTAALLARLFVGTGEMFGVDTPVMFPPPLHKLLPMLSPAAGFLWTDDAGLHFRGLEPFPASTLMASGTETSVAGVAMMTAILVPSLGAARNNAQRMQTAAQIQGVLKGAMIYAGDHDDKLPPDLATMVVEGYVPPGMVLPPGRSNSVPQDFARWTKAQQAAWVNANSAYIYLGKGKPNDTDSSIILIYENARYARDGRIAVAYGDAHVERLPVAEVLRQVAAQERAPAAPR